MHIHRSAVGIVVQAPAKLNLFFEVIGRRNDGYHEIETLMVPIDLYDTLHFTEDSSGQIVLHCDGASGPGGRSGSGVGELPGVTENIVVRAVELLRRRAKVTRGATLRLVKRIPIAAGLGGGSSDAAAALVAANQGWELGWSGAELAALAGELGSDVPFFLGCGPAVCRGRGEKIEPVSGLGMLHFAVVRPPAGLSTAAVYDVCQPAAKPRGPAPLIDALRRGNLAEAGRTLLNRLQPAAEKLSPWIERLKCQLAHLDCPGHQMSGSGTCYFALCRHARHARRVARRLQASGIGMVFAVRASR